MIVHAYNHDIAERSRYIKLDGKTIGRFSKAFMMKIAAAFAGARNRGRRVNRLDWRLPDLVYRPSCPSNRLGKSKPVRRNALPAEVRRPVFYPQPVYAAELADGICDEHETAGLGLASDQDVVGADGCCLCGESCADFARCEGVALVQIEDWEIRKQQAQSLHIALDLHAFCAPK